MKYYCEIVFWQKKVCSLIVCRLYENTYLYYLAYILYTNLANNSYLEQRISVSVQRENAAGMLGILDKI